MLAVNQTHLDSNRILYQWIFRFRSRKVYPQFFKTLHSLPPIQTFIFIRSLLCWPIASLTLRCLFTWGSRMHFLWCSEALFPFLSLPTLHQIGRVWYEWKLTNKKILERKQDHDAMNPSWITESLSVSKIIIPDISNRCATIHRMKLHTTQEYIYHQTCPISAIKISSTDWAQHHSGKHQTDDRCSAAVALSIHISIQSTVLTFASWNSSRFVLRSFENVA